MKRYVVLVSLLLSAPAHAEDSDAPGLMERGAQMFLEGLMQEVEPRLGDLQGFAQSVGPAMRDFVQEMGPALGELMEKVEDWSVYHPPEMLENGDIILRRKQPVSPDAGEPPVEDPIEL